MLRNSSSSTRLIASLKTLISSSSHQLLQCSLVSGTAKGKAKLKSGQPLKRSTFGRKKPAGGDPAAFGGGGRARNESIERLNRMVDSCLNAPTPLRHLTAKGRTRETESEKFGLISKERQREINKEKARAKAGGAAVKVESVIMGTPGLDLITLGLVNKESIPKYELTIDDDRRLAKEYSRVLMRKHQDWQAAETTLLRLKEE
ncbi:putative Aspartate carbamoyltransferase [Cocos nucifera]|uniref:Putative Aspartate carbamoyltransferase n=1 Tax=Cocos nucifera TaxID=13894 RepID=A0A8K0IFK9_COCNU|nr:putative Aspartate carbamoyltransferase [Cocos nucifera]